MRFRVWIGLASAGVAVWAIVVTVPVLVGEPDTCDYPAAEPAGLPEECVGENDPEACQTYVHHCSGCHDVVGNLLVDGPDLTGILGRRRHFADGTSLVADMDYIERSIARHGDESEFLPGFRDAPVELTALGLTPEEIAALASHVAELDLPEFEAKVRVDELSAVEDDRLDRIRATVPLVQELLRSCYLGALSTQSSDEDPAGAVVVDFRKVGRRYFGATIEDFRSPTPMPQVCADTSLNRLALLRNRNRLGGSLARYRFSLLPP